MSPFVSFSRITTFPFIRERNRWSAMDREGGAGRRGGRGEEGA
jgi:hypothetical protein